MPFHCVASESSTPGGVRYRTSAFPPHFATPPHEHEHPFLCLVLDGVSEQRAGSKEWRRDRGRAFFYPAGEGQSERFGNGGGRIFTVDLVPTEMRLPHTSSELAGQTGLLARRLHRASSFDDDLARLTVDETMMAFIGALSGELRDDLRWMSTVREYLHAHFAAAMTLHEIAAEARVHPVHLSRAFPQRFGMTLGDYVRALRIDYAARELTGTRRPIADIALDAGFSSQSHLTRHFRASMGIAPAAYRAAC
jgi:AraC family transcriptional regulator